MTASDELQCKGRLYLIMDYFPGGQFLDLLHKNAPFSSEAAQVPLAACPLTPSLAHVHPDLHG